MKKYVEYAIQKIIYSIARRSSSPLASILMMHRVSSHDKNNLPVYEMLKIEPDFLETFIIFCNKQGYTFLSIDEMTNNLLTGKTSSKNFVFSIDDGYKDAFTNAYPILKSYNIPFVFYISPSFPDKTAVIWWDILNDLIVSNNVLILNNGIKLDCSTVQQKQKVYIHLSKMILRMGSHVINELPFLLTNYQIELYSNNNKLLIDWEDIEIMRKDCLCTIGAHSTDHFGLRYEQNNVVLQDLIQCKSNLENKTMRPVKHLAFPYGTAYSVGFRESSLAKKAGYLTATTTFSSCIYKFHKNMLYFLPRINFHTVSNQCSYIY